MGQIEGAFVQGMGWLTSEELVWDDKGRLLTHGPSTYKIPGSRDVPPEFNIHILEGAPNRFPTIYRSKADGEPPIIRNRMARAESLGDILFAQIILADDRAIRATYADGALVYERRH